MFCNAVSVMGQAGRAFGSSASVRCGACLAAPLICVALVFSFSIVTGHAEQAWKWFSTSLNSGVVHTFSRSAWKRLTTD